MAFTKAQLEALKNSLLASNQPINAATHRAFVQNVIDEMYDAQSRGNLLAGVQANGTTAAGDQILVIRSGAASLIPASLFGSGISFDDLNGIVIVDPQDGDLLSYDAVSGTWQNIENLFDPSNFVNIAGAQNITGAKVFVNALLALTGSNPVFRVATSDNEATVNFRNAANEDAAGVVMATPANEVALVTRVNNMNIRIQPHGTGAVRFPAVPAAAGAVRSLVLDTNDRLRIGGPSLEPFKLLDEVITAANQFTSTTFASILTAGILGTNSFDGAVDASYEGTIWIHALDQSNSSFDLRFSIWSQDITVNVLLGSGNHVWNSCVNFKLIIKGGNFLLFGHANAVRDTSNIQNVRNLNPDVTAFPASGVSSLAVQARCLGTGPPSLLLRSFFLKQIL